ncbi:hypothetical protein [Bacillus sp. FJAT-45350]|uniref:hypothetical protein n=1 Tax=Bacillus sp. FJAT-45350 TaxID=2011014 RepID=UPI000BB8983D|nr:hypothetical protein [Bacillus sp. FJAT-45350]
MKRREIIFSAAIMVLIILNIASFNKINDIQQRMHNISNLQYEVQNINHSVQGINTEVQMTMDEILEEQLWVREKNYQITNVNLEEDQIDVLIEWSLRELMADEQLSMLYREEDDREWTELQVTNTNGLNYSLEYRLPLKGNYETQVMATSKVSKRSEKLLDLRFKEQLDSRIMTHADVQNHGNQEISVNIDIHNRLENEFIVKNSNDFKMKSANAFLYIDGTLAQELDLLQQNQNFHSDSYSESIYYHDFIKLENQNGVDMENIELRVIITDNLGMKYETIANSWY